MTAISALIHLDIPVKHICDGLKNTYWPARLQKIEKGNLFNLITDYNVKNELWIDGGHNADASVQLKKSMNFINKNGGGFTISIAPDYGARKSHDNIFDLLSSFKDWFKKAWYTLSIFAGTFER